MKILQIVHSLPFLNHAGTEVHTYNLSLELSKRHKVYILSRTCNIKQREYEISQKSIGDIEVYLVNNTFKKCESFEMYYENEEINKRFSTIVNEILPDVVHIQHLVFLSTGIIKCIRDRGIPIVYTLHDYWLMCPKWHILRRDTIPCKKPFTSDFDQECLSCIGELLNINRGAKRAYLLSKSLVPNFILKLFKKTYLFWAKKMLNNHVNVNRLKDRSNKIKTLLDSVDLFISPSQFLKDRYIEFGIQPERIKYLQHGFNTILFQDKQKSQDGRLRFAFIGTILPAKGLHILIKAFNNINKQAAELKIYGKLYAYKGFEAYLLSLKKSIKNRNIRFMGEFSRKDIADIFKEIDVLIVPSIWNENAPLVIQEAFKSGTPVIASDIGGIPELIRDRVNSLLFKPGDIKGLCGKIKYIIRNPGIIEEFKKNMPKIKSMKENSEEIATIYTDLTKENV